MPTPAVDRSTLVENVRAVKRFVDRGYPPPNGSRVGMKTGEKNAAGMAADAMGMNVGTLISRMKVAKERYGITLDNVELPPEPPERGEDDHDPIEILNRAEAQNDKYIRKKAMKPAGFIVPPEPFAVAVLGDPHLSSAGCNIKALREDIDMLVARGIRSIQLGDILDNFWAAGPKLAPKEADNHMTRDEALAVAKWFIVESGVKWDGHILGNHDLWLGPTGINIMADWVTATRSRLFDWNGRFIYSWGEGRENRYELAVSHDFKGHSQYNPLHGPAKMALWDGTADCYIAGHRHNHADGRFPNGYRGRTYQLARVRGYKDRDTYAETRPQFSPFEGMEGRSCVVVVNPLSETHSGKQNLYMDVGEGIEYLEFLKKRHGL